MELRVLGCSGTLTRTERTVGFLIGGRVLIDAGTVVTALDGDDAGAIGDVVLSHAHLDHVKELPFLAGARLDARRGPLRIHAVPAVLNDVRRHLFNDRIWPDLSVLPSRARPGIRYVPLRAGRASRIAGIAFTPVPVSHIVPCTGLIVEEGGRRLAYTSDTGPTDAIWRAANRAEVHAVLAEVSYPNRMARMAGITGHFTPALLARDLAKLERPDIPVYVYHLKPRNAPEIAAELAGIGRRTRVIRQDARIAI
jgi:cAMP phosphodiesterase